MGIKTILLHVKKHIVFLLAGISMILILASLGLFLGMSQYCYDLFFRLRGPAEPDKSIALIVIDEKTLNRYGQWPIARRHYATLLDRLAGARMVGMDILMIEPSPDDKAFAEAVSRYGRVVLPAYIAGNVPTVHASTLFSPRGAGHIHLEQDIDGVVRSVYHTLDIEGRRLPSFTSLIYENISGKPMKREAGPQRPAFSETSGIVQRDRRDIHYYGPQGTFPRFSMADVLGGRYDADFFRDKIVLVGVTAEGLESGVLTPFSQQRNHTSGVETHANILSNLLKGQEISRAPMAGVWVLSAVFSFLCFCFFIHWDVRRAIIGWLGMSAAVFAVSFLLFAVRQVWFSPIPFAVLILLMFILAYVIRQEEAGHRIADAKNLWEDSFNAIDNPIVVMDASGAPVQMNPAALRMQKEAPRLFSLMTSRRPREVLKSPRDENPSHGSASCGPAGDEIADVETDRNFEVRTLPRYDHASRPAGSVRVIVETTAQKKAAREKKRLEAELMQAQKMEAIGTLAGGVAHDFNNILMGIQGYVSLLLLEFKPGDSQYLKLKRIENQVQSASGLTRQLLGFARGGKYEVKPVDLNALVKNGSAVFGRTKKEVAIRVRYQNNLWPVMADAGQLEQVLLNMYINSWQAMPEGGDLYIATQNVVLGETDVVAGGVEPGRYVKISIADTGIGMDEETRRRVFEPFFTTKEPGKGTGLGLASAYGIIANHGGFIDLESEPGKGAAFQIFLPAAQEQPPVMETAPEEPLRRGKETMLIVDDEPSNVMVMKEILESLGYRVFCAGSGQEALSIYLLKKDLIDLVILDLVMPGMGGGATFDAIRSVDPTAKIILSSGYGIEGEVRKVLERGCNGFIQKPFRINELSDSIRGILNS